MTHKLLSISNKETNDRKLIQTHNWITAANLNGHIRQHIQEHTQLVFTRDETAQSDLIMKRSKYTIKKEMSFPLGPLYKPTDDDVLCGRGGRCFNHEGNKRFRAIVHSQLERYSQAKGRHEKGVIVNHIVDTVRQRARGGGFIKQDKKTDEWCEIGDYAAREKVGQTIRETVVQRDPQKREEHQKKRLKNKAKRLEGKLERSAKEAAEAIQRGSPPVLPTPVLPGPPTPPELSPTAYAPATYPPTTYTPATYAPMAYAPTTYAPTVYPQIVLQKIPQQSMLALPIAEANRVNVRAAEKETKSDGLAYCAAATCVSNQQTESRSSRSRVDPPGRTLPSAS